MLHFKHHIGKQFTTFKMLNIINKLSFWLRIYLYNVIFLKTPPRCNWHLPPANFKIITPRRLIKLSPTPPTTANIIIPLMTTEIILNELSGLLNELPCFWN